jgi:hypothetical protein
MASVYVTLPGFENHSLNLPGKNTIKQGIRKETGDPQKYVNGRYGSSEVLLWIYFDTMTFDEAKRLEKIVLRQLVQDYHYAKQHGKKEHFIIPIGYKARKKFADIVKDLYVSMAYFGLNHEPHTILRGDD